MMSLRILFENLTDKTTVSDKTYPVTKGIVGNVEHHFSVNDTDIRIMLEFDPPMVSLDRVREMLAEEYGDATS